MKVVHKPFKPRERVVITLSSNPHVRDVVDDNQCRILTIHFLVRFNRSLDRVEARRSVVVESDRYPAQALLEVTQIVVQKRLSGGLNFAAGSDRDRAGELREGVRVGGEVERRHPGLQSLSQDQCALTGTSPCGDQRKLPPKEPSALLLQGLEHRRQRLTRRTANSLRLKKRKQLPLLKSGPRR